MSVSDPPRVLPPQAANSARSSSMRSHCWPRTLPRAERATDTGMGGVPAPAWQTEMPSKCNLTNFKTWPPCKWYCDQQSCKPGQCHPNDVGCAHLAEVVYAGCKRCRW
jgi:hypothetical protein